MVSTNKNENKTGIWPSHTCKQDNMMASVSGGSCVGLRPASSLTLPEIWGHLWCRKLTHAATKVSPCSRILSVSHLSSLRYSRREARHERSITKGKRWTFSNIDNAFRSWATSRILDKRAWSCSALMYHSAIACITRGLTWGDWACQTWCRMIAEFGWLPRKMGIKLLSNSCLSLDMGCVSWRSPRTKTSGQCWTGSLSNSCTWLYNPPFSNKVRRISNNPRHFQLASFLLSGSGGDFKISTLIAWCG